MERQDKQIQTKSSNELGKIKICDQGKCFGVAYDDPDYVRRIESIMSKGDIQSDLGETIIWKKNVQKNTFFSKIHETWIISNFRVMKIDEKKHNAVQLPLRYLDALVINQRRSGQSQGSLAGMGIIGDIASGMAFSQRQETSFMVGDLVFMFNGQVLIIFENISDPEGVRKLVYMIKKQIYNQDESQRVSRI